MFPKPHRLPAPEIKNVLRSKNRVSSKELQLIYQKNNVQVSRFAVIVSNKIDKRATARNRAKRLLRESIWHLLPTIIFGWDVIILVRSNTGVDKQKDVEGRLASLLTQARLLTR